jgi:hypothetical protein
MLLNGLFSQLLFLSTFGCRAISPEPSESEQALPKAADRNPSAGVGLNHDSDRLSFPINPAQRDVERSSLPYQSWRKSAP